ncbi:hypothetical protein DSECCO2_625780 [anaerobic digester metagenome]
MVKVVSFTGALTDTGEHGDAAVVLGDVVDHLHEDNGLADAGTAEHAHLAALGEGDEQVDDLDAGFKHFDLGRLLGEARGRAVNRVALFGDDGALFVHGATHDVQDAAQGGLAYGHLDGLARVLADLAANEAVGVVHGDAADDAVAKVLGDFDDQVVFFGVDGRVGDQNGIQDARKFALGKLQVDNRPDDLHYFTGINSTHALCPLILSVPRHRLRCPLIGW